jgi:hypothetical protein
MAEVKVIEKLDNPYPDNFDQMEAGDYAIANYDGKSVVVIRCYHGNFQILDSDDGWDPGTKCLCRLLPKGTVIQITV